MKFNRVSRVAAMTILAATPFASPVSAAPLVSAGGIASKADNVVDVRWRGGGRHHGWRHHGWRHGYNRSYGWGPAVGGLAAGAIIGGAIANSQAQAAESDAYCSQRFKSYDPSSGTYLGYDGQRHACP